MSQNKEKLMITEETQTSLYIKSTSSLFRTSLNSRLIRWTAMLAMAVCWRGCCLQGGPGACLPVSAGCGIPYWCRSPFPYSARRFFSLQRELSFTVAVDSLCPPVCLPAHRPAPEQAPSEHALHGARARTFIHRLWWLSENLSYCIFESSWAHLIFVKDIWCWQQTIFCQLSLVF